jgi:hypothetical protein
LSQTILKGDRVVEKPIADDAVSIGAQLRDQISRIGLIAVIVFLFALTCIAAVFAVSVIMRRPVMLLTRDPAAVAEMNPFIGFLSNVGLMLWSATAAICFFGSAQMYSRKTGLRMARFLLLSGIFTLLLLFDDTFQLHENVLPGYFHLLQYQTYTIYAVITLGFFVYFYRTILSTDFILLIFAVLFLAVGALIEYCLPFGNILVFIEDSSKFLGIVFWLTYFTRTATRVIHGQTNLRIGGKRVT